MKIEEKKREKVDGSSSVKGKSTEHSHSPKFTLWFIEEHYEVSY